MESHLGIAARTCLTTLLAVVVAGIAGCGSGGALGTPSATGASSPRSASVAAASPTVTTQPSEFPSPGRGTAGPARTSVLLPVWPFTTAAQVRRWQAAYRSGGHQPWHLDVGQTALAFTRGHLGYVEVDRVTTRSIRNGDAHVGVGWRVTGARVETVAVLHLIRFGSGSRAPWVVVGTDDTDLTLDTPPYGATVTSPLRVGGRITGVDENLRVIVLGEASSLPLYASRGLPAGGVRTPWSTTVRFRAPHGAVLTIAVSTGGHLKTVERFAITVIRAA